MPGFVPDLEKQGLIPSKLLAEHDFFNDWFPEGKDSEGKSFPLQLEHLVQIFILMLLAVWFWTRHATSLSFLIC